MSDPGEARRRAATAITRVLRQGAYSNVVVEKLAIGLAPNDSARLKALTYGTLRRIEVIDEAITDGAGRPISKLEPGLVDRLRVSVFEVCHTLLPDPIAVSAGVDLAREVTPKAAGLANAVLRRASERAKVEDEALRLPDWLETSLNACWGVAATRAFAVASAQEPERVARVAPGHDVPGEPFRGIAGAVVLPPGPLPSGATVQDAASVAVGLATEADPGSTTLDLAAAPGGKTGHLLEQVGDRGLVIASDRHRRRVASAMRRVPAARWVVADARQPPFPARSFDRVLLDAPCSGLGTMRRRPEIRLRVTAEQVRRHARDQLRMVEAALPLVAPGGRLVYSVCTVTPEETVQVVENRGFLPPDLPGLVWGDGRLLAPHLTGTDGMFISVHRA